MERKLKLTKTILIPFVQENTLKEQDFKVKIFFFKVRKYNSLYRCQYYMVYSCTWE